jgi:linoleoyl-CoA desaturase
MKPQRIKFSNNNNNDFFETARKKVNLYFATKNISKFGDYSMVIKTIVMLFIYLAPYILLLTIDISSIWVVFFLWLIMGFGMAGIGLSIMHDANHGSYSKYPFVNKMLGYFINLVGGSATNWKIQHNVLHHAYTNVDGHDEDIATVSVLRLSPNQKRKSIHKYQYIYAWFLYSLMTIFWFTYKDIPQLMRYKKAGRLQSQNDKYGWLMFELIASKILYVTYILVIPILVLDIPWWATVLAFLTMQTVCGLLLTTIFQLAHIMPTSDFPLPDQQGNLENNWAIHQLHTTANFSPRSRIFSWYIGGLNYQIEHHLFPNVCHIHYKNISKIVKSTAAEYGIPYHSQPNFIIAIINHMKMLRSLGRSPVYQN